MLDDDYMSMKTNTALSAGLRDHAILVSVFLTRLASALLLSKSLSSDDALRKVLTQLVDRISECQKSLSPKFGIHVRRNNDTRFLIRRVLS